MELNCGSSKLESYSKSDVQPGKKSNANDEEEEEEEELEEYTTRGSGDDTKYDCMDELDFCELLAKFESVVHAFITEFIELQIYDASKADIPRHYNLKLKIKLMNHILKKFEPNVRKQLQEEILGTMCHIMCNQRKIYKDSVTNKCSSNYPEILCAFMQETNRDFSLLINRLRHQHVKRVERCSYRAEIANQQLQQLDCKGPQDTTRPISPRVIPDRHYLHVLDQVFKANCCGGQDSVYTMQKVTEFPPTNARQAALLGLSTAINPAAKKCEEPKKVPLPPLDLCGSKSFRSYGTALGGYGRMKMNEVAALQTFEESMLNYTLTSKCMPVLWCGSNRKGQPLLYSTACESDLSPIPLPMPCGPCGPLVQLYPNNRCGKKPRPSRLVGRRGKKHKKLKKKKSKPERTQTEDATSATDGEGDGSKKGKKKKDKKGKGKKKGKSKGRSKKKGKSKGGSKKGKGKSKGGSKKGKGKSKGGSKTKVGSKKGKGKSRSGSPKGKKGGKAQTSSSATGTDDPGKKSKGVGTSKSKTGKDKNSKGTQAGNKKGGKNKGTSAVVSTSDDESQTRLGKSKSRTGKGGKGKSRDASRTGLSRSPSRGRGRGKGKSRRGSSDSLLGGKSRSKTGKGGKGKSKSPKSRDASRTGLSRSPSRGRGKKGKSRRGSKDSLRGGKSKSPKSRDASRTGLSRSPSRGRGRGKGKSRRGSTDSFLGGKSRSRTGKGGRGKSKSPKSRDASRTGLSRSPSRGRGRKGKSRRGSTDSFMGGKGKSRTGTPDSLGSKRSRSRTGRKKGNGLGSGGSSDEDGNRRNRRDGKGGKHGGRSPSELRWKNSLFGKKGTSRSATNRMGSSSTRRGFLPPINDSRSHVKDSKSLPHGFQKSRGLLPPIGTKSKGIGVRDGRSKPTTYAEIWGRRKVSSIKAYRASDLKKKSGQNWKTTRGPGPGYSKSTREVSISKQGMIKPWGTGYKDVMKERQPERYNKGYSASMNDLAQTRPKSTPKFDPANKANPMIGPGNKPSSKFDPARKPGPNKYDPYNEGMKEQVRKLPEGASSNNTSYSTANKPGSKFDPARKPGPKNDPYNEGMKEQLRRPSERTSKYSTAYDSSTKDPAKRPMDHNPRYDPRYNEGMKEQLRRLSERNSKYGTTETTSSWRPSSAKSLPLLKKPDNMKDFPERAHRPTLGFVDDTFSSTLANTYCDRREKLSFLGNDCELPINLESPQENFFWVPLGRYSWEMRNIKVWKSQVINPRESLGSKEYMGIFPEINVPKAHVNMSDLDLSTLSKKLRSSTNSCCRICNICLLDTCYCQCR